jgi:hypothetical protein
VEGVGEKYDGKETKRHVGKKRIMEIKKDVRGVQIRKKPFPDKFQSSFILVFTKEQLESLVTMQSKAFYVIQGLLCIFQSVPSCERLVWTHNVVVPCTEGLKKIHRVAGVLWTKLK